MVYVFVKSVKERIPREMLILAGGVHFF